MRLAAVRCPGARAGGVVDLLEDLLLLRDRVAAHVVARGGDNAVCVTVGRRVSVVGRLPVCDARRERLGHPGDVTESAGVVARAARTGTGRRAVSRGGSRTVAVDGRVLAPARAGRRLRGGGLDVREDLGPVTLDNADFLSHVDEVRVLNGRLVVVVDRFPGRVVMLGDSGEGVSWLDRVKDSRECKCRKHVWPLLALWHCRILTVPRGRTE